MLAIALAVSATGVIHARALDLCDLPDLHDASAHRWSAKPRPAAAPDGHFLCHAARALGAAPAPPGLLAVETGPSSVVRPVLEPSFGLSATSRLPTRSPPR